MQSPLSKKNFRYYESNQIISFDARTFASFILTLTVFLSVLFVFFLTSRLSSESTAANQNDLKKSASTLQLIETITEEPELIKQPETQELPAPLPTPETTTEAKQKVETPKDVLIKPQPKIEPTPTPVVKKPETKPGPSTPKPEEKTVVTNVSGAGGASTNTNAPLSVSTSPDLAESEEHIFYRKILESMISEKLNQYKNSFPDKWKTVGGSYIIELTLQEKKPPKFNCITPSQNFYFNQVSEVILKNLDYPPLKKYNLTTYHQIFIFTYRPYGERQ